ncbi:unnamed protein product [Fusarium graminearum]|uniref:Chromosome 1, complete genome n=2 Tax=Gibberella zeae TaxID=5518 RepID=A0A098D702_GIBZE|nr:unnamed protein product [Fusarium graminearum]CAG1989179.1 unnamed protein product [Fusarium graminearum]CAG2017640.1 unnamed protein product [Fusarium graminearum]CEF74739.1 unnamed protein product [Fusarium graminearum]CZS78017.1 unnamed protein product [Fusarium graminearum]
MRSTPVTDTQMMYCNRPIEWTFLGEFEPQQGIASTTEPDSILLPLPTGTPVHQMSRDIRSKRSGDRLIEPI